MFKIALNKMYLSKGDTARFSIGLDPTNPSNIGYTLSNADTIYFIVTETPEIVRIEDLSDPTKFIFYKQGMDIVIEPSDTDTLIKDTYYYQVRVILGQSGDTNTLIEPEEFNITPMSRVI